jgi:uncharacterized protein (TIRG00374 family)
MSRSLRIGLSVAVSLLCLGFAVRGVDWGKAVEAMRDASYGYVFLMLPLTVWSLYVRAQRWRVFLGTVGTAPMSTLVSATNIGFMANMVLPLRVGEVIRPVLLSRKERLPLSGVLGSCLLERIFDMFTILLLFGVSTLLVDDSKVPGEVVDKLRAMGVTLTTLALLVGGVVAALRFFEGPTLRLARVVCNLLPTRIGDALYTFVEGFVKALEMLDGPIAFARAFGWSLFLWFVIALLYVLGFIAFHLEVPMLLGALVVTAVVAIAVSVPSAPGFIGAYQLGCVLALAIFAVGENDAVAFSIVLHLTQFVAVIGAGLYSLWREGMSFSEVGGEADGESGHS